MEHSIPKPVNPLHLPTRKLPVACPILSRLLNGGLPLGSITELSGESATGKTQLSLHLLLSTSPSTSLFIHTDFPFPLRRLHSLLPNPNPNPNSNPLDHILISGAHSPHELLALLSHAQRTILPQRPEVRLLVVDSIAALFRSDSDLRRRSGMLFRIAGKLKEIAERFWVAVVVTNHVVDVVEDGGVRVGNYREMWTSGRRVWPALGLAWGSCVNMRLFLSREEEVVRGGGEGEVRTKRMIWVVFAPHLPEGSVEFVIQKEGVFGVCYSYLYMFLSLNNDNFRARYCKYCLSSQCLILCIFTQFCISNALCLG